MRITPAAGARGRTRRWAGIALSLAVSTASGGPDSTAEYDALPYRDTWGDFRPAPDDMRRIGELMSQDSGYAVFKELPAAERVRLVRTGLRSESRQVAAVAASWADSDWLDLAEHRVASERIVDQVLAHPGEWPNGLANLIEHFSGAQARPLLERIATVPPAELEEAGVSTLHKVMRPDALPVLADLLGPLDGDVPLPYHELVWLHAWHTDQRREAVARVFLGDAVCSELPAAGTGVPALLKACLEKIEIEEEGQRARHVWWAIRWLRDSVPAESDVAWLSALRSNARPYAAWAMRHLHDEASGAFLAEAASAYEDDPETAVAAAAALAVRGDLREVERLRDLAADDALALAFLLELAPEAAVDDLFERLIATDGVDDEYGDASSYDVLNDVEEAMQEARLRFALQWGPEAFEGFEDRLLASDAGPQLLLWSAASIPGCRTRRMAAEIMRRVAALEEPQDLVGSSLLELGAPDAYRAYLRRVAALDVDVEDENEEAEDLAYLREGALATLLSIGDPAAGSLLVAAFREGAFSDPNDDPLVRLSRSPCPEVQEFLREQAESGDVDVRWQALRALAMMDGLPEGVELTRTVYDRPSDSTEPIDADALEEVARLVLDGRPVDAFARLIEAAPSQAYERAGDVDDPRVTAYLRGLQQQREQELYWWATAELGIQGDPEARAEAWQAIRRGSYRWCDELDMRQRTMGFDLGTLPVWADFFESSCCQFPTARLLWDHLLDAEPAYDKGQGFTGRDWAHRWLADHPGPLVWSRAEECFVPQPR